MKFKPVDLIVEGPIYGGVDWGKPLKVIVSRLPKCELVWIGGHTAYVDRGTGSVYVPSRLAFLDYGGVGPKWPDRQVTLLEGGRLSCARLEEQVPKIADLFGVPEVEICSRIHSQMTIIIKE